VLVEQVAEITGGGVGCGDREEHGSEDTRGMDEDVAL
jgi:hypothetical protein